MVVMVVADPAAAYLALKPHPAESLTSASNHPPPPPPPPSAAPRGECAVRL